MTWLALVLAAFVFALDIVFLNGRGEAVLYVIVVLIFLWSTHWRYVPWVAALCTVLTLIGFYTGTEEVFEDAVMTNHIFSFVAIWFTALLGMWTNHLSDKLSESELRMRMIVESAAEGIITTDDTGMIESCNLAAADIFCYDRDEIIGHNVTQLSTNVTELAKHFGGESGGPQFLTTSATATKATRELTGVRKDGSEFPMLIAASEMWLHDRRYFSGIVMDMTELRTAQSTAIQSARLAAIGEAMAGLAHESRNALQRSQAALEMLAREVGDQGDAAELIERIQAAQEDLHTLYEEVRGYAAPLKMKIQTHRIDECVGDAWEKLEVVRGDRDADLQCGNTISPDALASSARELDASALRLMDKRQPGANALQLTDFDCEFDSFVMRRVFRNLFENSLAAGEDPVRIDVTFSVTTLSDRPAITIRVRDNGPGLNESELAKLFVPFFTTKTTGTGLGMAIARRYVEGHGGTITVPWPTDGGAEFLITLPRTQT